MKVPQYERQVGQADLPGVRQNISVDANNFLGGTDKAFLNSATGAADSISEAALKVQLQHEQEANRTRSQDAFNQFETRRQDRLFGQNGAFNQRGQDVFAPQNGKPLADNVIDDLHKDFGEIYDSLGNDEQKRLFAEHAQPAITHTRGQLLQFEGEQHRVYQRGVGLSTIDTQQKTIGLNYNNPELVRKSLDAIYSTSVDLGKLEGFGEEYGAAQAQKHKSNALNMAIESALAQNDHASATKILRDFAPDMEPNDVLKMAKTITTADYQRQAHAIGQSVISELYPRMEPSDLERLKNIVRNSESGNQRYGADGQLLTSAKGAQGEMQVMPLTARDPGYGVKPAQNDSPDELARVGEDYLTAMIKEYKGDPAKALAAYNAGPGRLNDALKQAADTGKDWLSYLPKETQGYVDKNMKSLSSGDGRYPPPTLADVIQFADRKVIAQHGENADPEIFEKAREEATYQFKVQDSAVRQRQDEAINTAYRAIEQAGGNINAVDLSAVPGDKQPVLKEFAQKVRNNDDMHNPQAWAHFMTLSPGELAKMTPDSFYAEYRGQLDNSHMDKGLAMVKDARGSDTEQAHLEVITTTNRIKNAAQQSGILPYNGAVSKDQAQRFRLFETTVDQRVREFESQLSGKRKATSDELQKIIDTTLLDKVFVNEWGSDPQRISSTLKDNELGSAYVTVGNEDINLASIPASQRAIIITKLQRRGLPVTETAIAQLWVSANKPN